MSNSNEVVRVSNDIYEQSSNRLVGQTVGYIRNSDSYCELLDLRGEEVVQVVRSGQTLDATDSFVLRAGDHVRFSRSTGGKGSVLVVR